ncbi:hypothetical protein [Candidatus Spongiihabitans sp.]|uniref:hypothetical protein n=1 Tax=Candidatus Spongiihabitans sp. TaxID=3101308 RepID=UPI003C7A0199
MRAYLSAPHACPYIEPETAATVLLEPDYKVDNALFSVLLNSGFRRNGKTIYRPHCRNCNACVSARIPASAYLPNRAQLRRYKKIRTSAPQWRPPVSNRNILNCIAAINRAHRRCHGPQRLRPLPGVYG